MSALTFPGRSLSLRLTRKCPVPSEKSLVAPAPFRDATYWWREPEADEGTGKLQKAVLKKQLLSVCLQLCCSPSFQLRAAWKKSLLTPEPDAFFHFCINDCWHCRFKWWRFCWLFSVSFPWQLGAKKLPYLSLGNSYICFLAWRSAKENTWLAEAQASWGSFVSMQIILGICCLFESFLLSWAISAAQVWPCALASVLSCPEPLLSKHLWGSCGASPFSQGSRIQHRPPQRLCGAGLAAQPSKHIEGAASLTSRRALLERHWKAAGSPSCGGPASTAI